jgi:hypothetical protein
MAGICPPPFTSFFGTMNPLKVMLPAVVILALDVALVATESAPATGNEDSNPET